MSSRMLLEKRSAEGSSLSVMVSDQAVALRNGAHPLALSFRTRGRLSLDSWTHLVLQVTRVRLDVTAWCEGGLW